MSLYKTKLSSHDYLTMINKKKDSPLQSKIYAAFLIYIINVMVCQHIFGYLSFMLLFWFNKYHDLSAYFSLICLPFFCLINIMLRQHIIGSLCRFMDLAKAEMQ